MASAVARRRRGSGNSQTLAGWLFVSPVIIILGLFLFIPILMAAWVSVSDWNGNGSPLSGTTKFVGFDNYAGVLGGKGLAARDFGVSIRNNLYYVALVVPLQTIMSLFLAVMVTRKGLRGKSFFRTAFYFPSVTSIPEPDVVLGFRETGASNGWLDVGSSITSGVHFANGSTLTRGSYLVAAHVNSRDLSLSPFAKLWQVEAGMLVWVTDAENVAHRFVVVALGTYDKQALPADVFDPDRASQLVLVTCGGKITEMPNGTRQYAQNVVVRAVPFD